MITIADVWEEEVLPTEHEGWKIRVGYETLPWEYSLIRKKVIILEKGEHKLLCPILLDTPGTKDGVLKLLNKIISHQEFFCDEIISETCTCCACKEE